MNGRSKRFKEVRAFRVVLMLGGYLSVIVVLNFVFFLVSFCFSFGAIDFCRNYSVNFYGWVLRSFKSFFYIKIVRRIRKRYFFLNDFFINFA